MSIDSLLLLPALAISIYRAHLLNEHKIPKLSGQLYLDIKNRYTGGSVVMFIPTGDILYNIHTLTPTIW